jgi:hypothetical protein
MIEFPLLMAFVEGMLISLVASPFLYMLVQFIDSIWQAIKNPLERSNE